MKFWICLTMLLLAPPGLMAGPQAPAGAATDASAKAAGVAALIAKAGQVGKEARLPPHVVDVLGLGTHVGGLAVRQLALRNGSEVRAFNVSTENSVDIVIFDYDEATKSSQMFLLTPAGKLRRAITFIAGGESHSLATAEGRRRFKPQLDYWLAILRSASPASR
ncbi:MAG TPA: hypothetical protein VK130_09505 [Steroidobacteraceae bacterium]|nr:hypothetical protein [Steroidobacteraceae bacterium]